MKKLLIIGNGFDLNCGLNSSYSDFYQHLIKKDYYYKQVAEQDYSGKFNILWVLFYINRDKNKNMFWRDIEELMHAFLYGTKNNLDISYNNVIQFLSDNFSYIIELKVRHIVSSLKETKLREFLEILGNVGISDIFFKSSNRENKITNFEVTDFVLKTKEEISKRLKEDLKEIEEEFSKFLYEQTKSGELGSCSNDLIKRLTGLEVVGQDLSDKLEILSFNYTRFGVALGGDKNHGINLKNIHGTFMDKNNSEIIFGVDSIDISPNDPFYIFTKTFRVSMLDVSEKWYSSSLSLKETKEIIIYGHSLGFQDYSYFFAIFNVVNLNQSDVKLTLFYSNYDYNDQALKNLLALQNLIFEYENRFNLPKGLYQRLILEERILVKELKKILWKNMM